MANGNGEYNQIVIQGKRFRVPYKYKAGDVLKENEAAALNQTFHENLRNNFANKVRDGVEAGMDDATLQQQLDDYVTDYEFGVRTGGGRASDPVMTLAMNIARDVVRKAIKEKGLDPEAWSATKVSQAAKAYLESQGDDGQLMQVARQQIESERKAAKEALDQVLEIIDQQAAQ